jgi:hypothetical protein
VTISKNISWFSFLSIIVFVWGTFNNESDIPYQEYTSMFIIFFIILFIQVFLIYFSKNYSGIISILFLCGNFIFFNLVLSDENKIIKIIYLILFAILSLIISYFKNSKKLIVFFSILTISITIKILSNFNIKKKLADKNDGINKFIKKKGLKNIFIIGIDGMVSNKFYTTHYSKKYPTKELLETLGFYCTDINSTGISTLETYAGLINYNKVLISKNYRKVFNSSKSAFYLDSKSKGYKLQFNFNSNYFGGNSNQVYDSFYPNILKPFGFIGYTNERWGWYSIKLIKSILTHNLNDNNLKEQSEMILNQISHLNLISDNWISISHLWYPGHTIGDYNANDFNDYSNFKSYYIESQPKLKEFIKKITISILQKDKNAVIIFWGDHGSYLYKGALENTFIHNKLINNEMLISDKREILLAVFPFDFLNTNELITIKNKPEKILKILIDKN